MSRIIIAGLAVLTLVGCGAADNAKEATFQPSSTVNARTQSLMFAYPMDQQTEIPVSAPVVLRFTSAISSDEAVAAISMTYEKDGETELVPFNHRLVDGGRGLVVTPEEAFLPLTEYSLSIEGLSLTAGQIETQSLSFVTQDRPGSGSQASQSFSVKRMIPDGNALPLVEFSSLRLQFTQPLERSSVSYGSSLSLLDPDNGLVDANVLVSEYYMTVDPKEDLRPGVAYQLQLTSDIQSLSGQRLSATELSVVPQSTGTTANFVLEVVDSAADNSDDVMTSVLTGYPVNVVPLASVFLGNDSEVQLGDRASGDSEARIVAQLAEIPVFERRGQAIPARISKGSVLNGTELDILFGGVVPLGFDSGELNIEFVSDAIGFLLKNPYSNRDDALRQIVFFGDVAITTADSRANGAVTQTIQDLQMVGMVEGDVSSGSFVLDTVGAVELSLLGLEDASSFISFKLVSFPDQNNVAMPALDTVAPSLQSWIPGSAVGHLMKPSDPIVLTFDEPVMAVSSEPSALVTLSTANGMVPFSYFVDGASLVIKPQQPLATNVNYTLNVQPGIAGQSGLQDMAGNLYVPPEGFLTFKLPAAIAMEAESENEYSPVVLSTYPGFPCTSFDYDLANNDVGPCLGGGVEPVERRGGNRSSPMVIPAEDRLPLAPMPANRVIRIAFSRDMDPATVNEATFAVEQVDVLGNSIAPVSGSVQLKGSVATFTPDSPWKEGAYYRYKLMSVKTGLQCGINAMCDYNGYPLQTRLLAPSLDTLLGPTQGGLPLAIFFKGAAKVDTVLTPLSMMPTADVNTNFTKDEGEVLASAAPEAYFPELLAGELGGNQLANGVVLSVNPEAAENAILAANPTPDQLSSIDIGETAATTFRKDGLIQYLVVNDLNVGCGFEAEECGLIYDENGNPIDFRCAAPKTECPDEKYLHLTSSLLTEVFGEVTSDQLQSYLSQEEIGELPVEVQNAGGVLAYVYPSQVIASSMQINVEPAKSNRDLLYVFPIDTGPAVIRVRHRQCTNGSASCLAKDLTLARAWVYTDSDGNTKVWAKVKIYVDVPRLNPIAIVSPPPACYNPALRDPLICDPDKFSEQFRVAVSHSFRNHPLDVELEGVLTLLDDGRTVVQLVNVNQLDIAAEIEVPICSIQSCGDNGDPEYFPTIFLKVAPKDVVLNLISPPIKN